MIERINGKHYQYRIPFWEVRDLREYQKDWRANHPEYSKTRRQRNRQQRRDYLERKAGRARPEVCDICGEKAIMHFDHDHMTGRFRGWLCRKCNVALGMFKDDAILMKKAAEYITRHVWDTLAGRQ